MQVNVRFFSMNIALYIHHPQVAAWRFTSDQVKGLQESLPDDRVFWVQSEPDFLKILPDMEAAVVWRFEESWFEKAPALRWVATPAAGKDHLPPPREGIVYSFGRFHGLIMSETVLGMVLFASRNLPGWSAAGKEEAWPQAGVSKPMKLLAGSRVVLCGFGPIGQAIGYRLKQHHVRLTVIRKHPEDPPAWMDVRDQVMTFEQADEDRVWE